MIVIVGGMHRSGTSALAGMLHSNGIVMGRDTDFFPPPMRENPKGFFENKRFRKVNDTLLRDNNYRVKSFSPVVPVIKNGTLVIRTQMENLITEYSRSFDAWGWKDPRTCLTMEVWLAMLREMDKLKDLRVVVIHRKPEQVARSMLARGNRGPQVQFEELTRMYVKRLLTAMRGHHVKPFETEFDYFIAKTDEVAKELSAFLDWDVTDTSFVDPAIAARVV